MKAKEVKMIQAAIEGVIRKVLTIEIQETTDKVDIDETTTEIHTIMKETEDAARKRRTSPTKISMKAGMRDVADAETVT